MIKNLKENIESIYDHYNKTFIIKFLLRMII